LPHSGLEQQGERARKARRLIGQPSPEALRVSEVSFRGGSRVGWVNATWPFAGLTASATKLTLATFGKYEFSPQQVVSFEFYGSLPLFSSGIRIVHNRLDYPDSVVFWCMGSRERVLRKIREAGFVPQGQPPSTPRATGFPLRWSVVALFLVIWNGLFLMDGTARWAPLPGAYSMTAILLTFVFSICTDRFERLQKLVLREGHGVGEIKPLLRLVQLILGLMLVICSVMWITGAGAANYL
jgi:hypothetical protein